MKDNEGHNARWHATGECKEILANVEECTACKDLFEAAEKGCEDCCKRLIGEARQTRNDVKLDKWADSGSLTALMVASFCGKTACVRILAK